MNKKYRVCALVTISVHTDVVAESEEQALEMAEERSLAAVHHSIYDTTHLAKTEWVTSGELDGTPFELRVES